MKFINDKKSVLNDNRRLDDLFSTNNKVNQVIEQAKRKVNNLLETSQKLAFEVCIGNRISEIYSGDTIA